MHFIFGLIDYKWDFRIDQESLWVWLTCKNLKKDAILNGEKKPRDYLFNLYFAKPDYEEVPKKLYYSSFAGAKLAILSSAAAIASSQSRNSKLAMIICSKHFGVIGGGALTYGVVAAAVANLRGKKDDIWNHAAAGGSLGFIYGYLNKCSGRGAVFGLLASVVGVLMKSYSQTGRSLSYDVGERALTLDGNRCLEFKTDSEFIFQHYPRENRLR